MRDDDATIGALKRAVRALCLDKGWGVDGEQNPQHVAMAMTVEMAELLENFQWLEPDGVRALWDGKDPDRRERIAGEFADVMMYALQLAFTLDIDVADEIERKIAAVRGRSEGYYEEKRRMRDQFERDHRRVAEES